MEQEQDSMEQSAHEMRNIYVLYHNICDIFQEDAKHIYEKYLALKKDACDKYGAHDYMQYFDDIMKNVSGYKKITQPKLIRQFTFKGNDLWTLVKTAIFYKEQAENKKYSGNNSLIEGSMTFYLKYKSACIFKYGESSFNEVYNNIIANEIVNISNIISTKNINEIRML
jgi:hypothetical protein